jgi:hypothetical protein
VDGGVLWRNGCDGKVLRYGAGERHQQVFPPPLTRANVSYIDPILIPAEDDSAIVIYNIIGLLDFIRHHDGHSYSNSVV